MYLVDAMTEKGHRCGAAIQRTFMRGGLDSLGQPANDAKTSPAKIPGKLVCIALPLPCRVAAPYNGECG